MFSDKSSQQILSCSSLFDLNSNTKWFCFVVGLTKHFEFK